MTALSFLPRSAGSSSCAASKKRTMRCVVMMVLSGLVGVVSGFGVPSTSTSTTTTTTTTTHTPFVFGMSTKWCPQPPVQQQSKSRLWFQPDDEEDKQLFWPSDDWKEEERIQRMAMFLSSHLGRAVLKTCLQKKEEQEPSEEPDVPEEAETLSAPVTPAAAAEEEDVLLKEEEEKHSVSLHQREGDRVLALKDEFSTGEEDVAPSKPQDVRNFGKPLPVIVAGDENADVTNEKPATESKVSLVPGAANVDRDTETTTTTASLRDKAYVDTAPQPLTSSTEDDEEEEERAISMHEKEGDRMVSLKDEFSTGTNVANNNDNNNNNNDSNNLPPVVSTMFGRPLEVIESGLSPISDGHDPPPGQATTSSSTSTISSSSTSLQAGYSSSLVEQDSTTTMSSSTATTQETSSMQSSSLSQLDVLNNLQLMAQASSPPPPPPPSAPSLSRSSSSATTTTTTTYYNNNGHHYHDYEHDTTRTPSSVEAQLDAKLLAQLEEALMGPNSPSANKGTTSTVGGKEEDAATADDEDSAMDGTTTGTMEQTSTDDFANDDTDAAVLETGDSSNDDTDVTVSTMEVSTMADAATNDLAVDTATAAAADKPLGDETTDLDEDISAPLAAAAATTSDSEEEVLATPKTKHVVLDRVKKSLGKVVKKRTAETTTTRAMLDIPTVMDDGNDEETPSNNDNNKNHVVAARAIVDQVKTQAKKISAEARDLVTGRARDISTSAGAAYTKNNRAGGGAVVGSNNNDKKKKKKKKFKKPTNNNNNEPRNVDLQETAFQSLLKLRMFRITPNPKDPGYDHSDDDELCPENVWVDPNHKNGAAVAAIPTRGITSTTSPAAATATTVQLSNDEKMRSDFLSIPSVNPSSSTVAATTRTEQEEFSVETSSSFAKKKKKNKELEERAFQILLDLGMIRITPNPNDPYYDHTDDNELCPENVWIN